ncbi:hypothetical protein JNUCC0626_47500 [Lentzea sp. JNUCC 0626]|uniref:nucleotide-binding domain-containing protein n=1 Tax=Lentzea sp. JNUCC 0626 TaxID=3367513 RepID=UPI00374797D7
MPRKKLLFTIVECDAEEPCRVKWKVLNRGSEAERLDQVRGQIVDSTRSRTRSEVTTFHGDHYVECYVIKDSVVGARSHINVPIKSA